LAGQARPRAFDASVRRPAASTVDPSDVEGRESTFERDLVNLTRWMSAAPASLARLDRKGRIEAGYDADFMVWDPDAEYVVDPVRLQQRHKLTPYAGRHLRGAVRTTFVRGERVWDEDRLVRAGSGRLL
jgi:allantoinase